MPWAAVGAVAGGLLSSRSSRKAAKAQAKAAEAASQAQLTAARESNALQEKIYNQNRTDSAPWRDTGEGALNQLAWKMGITPTNRISGSGGGGGGGGGSATTNWREAPSTDTPGGSSNPLWERIVARQWNGHKGHYGVGWDTRKTGAGERASNMQSLLGQYMQSLLGQYNAQKDGDQELAAYGAKIDAANAAKNEAARYKGDQGDFGSLMRNFTMADRDADPVYQSGLQFGLDQGVQGIERQAAATGSQLSGATLKALARYGNDYGSTKAQGAYERFGTNQATIFNRLSGIAGTGQQSVNQIGAAGQNFANQVGANNINTAANVGANTMAAGQARASGYANQSNALNNAIGSVTNAWQQNNMLNRLNPQ